MMARKRDQAVSFAAGYLTVRHMNKKQAQADAADQMAWEQQQAEVLAEQRVAGETAAAAARDEARRQGEITRLHNWMMTDPVGQAWRKATAPGGADTALAERVRAKNIAWRQAWTRQCAADGLAPVTPAKVSGGWLPRVVTGLAFLLLAVAVLLFLANTGAWLINHSWFTTKAVPDMDSSTSTMVPKRGTREFLTPALAVWSYVAAGAGALVYAAGRVLGHRHEQARAAARQQASERNAALEAERAQHYGFDPLAARLPVEAQWAALPDGTGPEAAVPVITVEDVRQRQRHEYMQMDHAERMQVVADWGGRVRADTPEVLPPGMTAELERMRG